MNLFHDYKEGWPSLFICAHEIERGHRAFFYLMKAHLFGLQIKRSISRSFYLAGVTGLEPATNGFGDRYSTN